jgi:hypothetical protein
VLRKLNSLFNVDYTNKLLDTRALLFRMYNRYDAMYGSVRLKRVVPASLSGKKRTAWADIYDDNELDIGAGCSSLLTFMMIMSLTLELAILPSLLILISPGVFLPLLCYKQLLLLTLVSLHRTGL